MQKGATPGRSVTENIHIIQYLIQKTCIKKNLYILSIDFTKAYDSIERLNYYKYY